MGKRGWGRAAGSAKRRCEGKDGEVLLFGVSTVVARLWVPARGGPSQHPGCCPQAGNGHRGCTGGRRGWGQRAAMRGWGGGGVTRRDALPRSRGRAKQNKTGGRAARGVMPACPNQQGQLMQSCRPVPRPRGEGTPHQHCSCQGLPGAQASLGAFILMSTTWLFFLQP